MIVVKSVAITINATPSARAELKELFPGDELGSQLGSPLTRIEEETETISLKISATSSIMR